MVLLHFFLCYNSCFGVENVPTASACFKTSSPVISELIFPIRTKNTVKPVCSDQPRDQRKVVVIGRVGRKFLSRQVYRFKMMRFR